MVRNVEKHKEEQVERQNWIKDITERKFQDKVQEVQKLKQIATTRLSKVTLIDKELDDRYQKFKLEW